MEVGSEIGSPGAGDLPCGPNNTIHNHHFVTVINTTFLNNKATVAGALSIEQGHRKIVCANRIIMFQNCVFTNSTSTTGSAEAILVADEIFVPTAVSSGPKDTFNYDN